MFLKGFQKLGEKQHMWITKLKIALVQKNIDQIKGLVNEVPKFDDVKDVKEAMYLLKEATELLFTLQGETESSMKQIKKNLDFLKSTAPQQTTKLDIKS